MQHGFGIIPSYANNNPLLMPRVKMNVNDFVIGNLQSSGNNILEFYKVNLPFESEYVIIDWQADFPSLFINIGNQRPILNSEQNDFVFQSIPHDTVIRINKSEIIKRARENRELELNNTIRNLELTIGIYTNKLSDLYTTTYAFKIFLPPAVKEDNSDSNE